MALLPASLTLSLSLSIHLHRHTDHRTPPSLLAVMAAACRAAIIVALLSLSLFRTSAASLLTCCSTRRPLLSDRLSSNAEETGCHRRSDVDEEEEDGMPELVALAGDAQGSATLKLQLKYRSATSGHASADAVVESVRHDLHRIQTLHRRITMGEYQNAQLQFAAQQQHHRPTSPPGLAGQLVATFEAGASLGYGEFLVDIFVGTPPRYFSLVLDTGSDLSWLQCLPCYECFEQRGPHYDPARSSTYRPVPCADRRCGLVSSPGNPLLRCRSSSQTCTYFYPYNEGEAYTEGELALETFTVGLAVAHRTEDVIFGCGHWNRGGFRVASGLLGLGRGPLSFSSQLRPLYGGVFSYCLVDWHSGPSVRGKLVFGEDRALMAHPYLNFTSLITGAVETFYYVRVKGIKVAGEVLDIPPETWEPSPEGQGGAIVDSGATLSHFTGPAYRAIHNAVKKIVNDYPAAAAATADFPELTPCYNITGINEAKLPDFAIVFADGAVWNFPQENFFIRLREVVCLAVLHAGRSMFSMVLGNYQQQNFHVVYDAGRSRLGFAPARCADV